VTSCYSTGNVSNSAGKDAFDAGGFIGFHFYGDIINCYSTGSVTVSNYTVLSGFAWYVGGFIGKLDLDCTLLRNYSSGGVTIQNERMSVDGIGGFAGMIAGSPSDGIDGYVRRCWSTGDVTIEEFDASFRNAAGVGGFVGVLFGGNDTDNSTQIENSYAWGSVICSAGEWKQENDQAGYGAGGFIGSIDGGITEDLESNLTLNNCYCAQTNVRTGSGLTDQITYTSGVSGGFLGKDHNATIYALTVTNSFFDTTTAGFVDDDSTTATGGLTATLMTKATYTDAGWAVSTSDGVKDDINSIWMIADVTGGTSDQSRTVAYPQDWAHIEGQTVQILGDGEYLDDQTYTISSGQVSPAIATSNNHIGLQITSKLQPMKIDGEVNVKKISALIADVYESVGGEYGSALDDMYTMELRATGDPMDRDAALHSGYVELPFKGLYDRSGDIWITQDIPLPMTLRGLGIRLSKEEVS
jgi:hypothetical protein